MPANLGDPVIHTDDVSRRETSLVDSPLTSTLNPATQRFTQPCPIRFVRMTGACVCTRSKFSSKILVHSWTWSGPPHGSHVTCKSSRMPISRFSFLRDLPMFSLRFKLHPTHSWRKKSISSCKEQFISALAMFRQHLSCLRMCD